MNTSRLKYLCDQYINDSCTAEELSEFAKLIRQPEHEQVLIGLLDEAWDTLKKDTLLDPIAGQKADEIYNSIVQEPQHVKSRFPQWVGIAASIAIVISIGIGIYLTQQTPASQVATRAATDTELTTDIAPGSSKALLVLDDGNTIELDQASEGLISTGQGSAIQNTRGGQLIYTATESKGESAELSWNTLYIPRGGQYKLILADGTNVYLNAESSLKYPVKFAGKERNVILTGEAYFEVAKNKNMPFKVNVNNVETIEVLGTHFNVSAYQNDPFIKTTLLEGSVKVSHGKAEKIIRPGQVAVGNPESGVLVAKEADIDEAMAWRNGLFLFNDENIVTIMTKVARWYDIEVDYKGAVEKVNIIGNYSKDKSLSSLLSSLEMTGNVRFQQKGRRVTVLAK